MYRKLLHQLDLGLGGTARASSRTGIVCGADSGPRASTAARALGPLQTDIDVDFSDLVDVLAGAALIHVEAATRRHWTVRRSRLWRSNRMRTAGPAGRSRVRHDDRRARLSRESVGRGRGVRCSLLGLRLGCPTDQSGRPRQRPGLVRWLRRRALRPGDQRQLELDYAREHRSRRVRSFLRRRYDVRPQARPRSVRLRPEAARRRLRKAVSPGIPFRMDTMFLGATVGYAFD